MESPRRVELECPSVRQWAYLGGFVAIGFLLRLGYLLWARSSSGYQWADPDSYLEGARLLAGANGWSWSFEVVTHSVEGHDFFLPPLYPVFLSIFALGPGFPLTAQLAQVLLGTSLVALVFELARRVHSVRAGLFAAAIWTFWLPNIISVWSTMQEALFVPLALAGLTLSFRAWRRPEDRFAFVLAGMSFGAAALVRSLASYFVLSAVMLLPVMLTLPPGRALGWTRRRAFFAALGLALGFASLTVPYSVALSRHLQRATFIENHGGLRVASTYGEFQNRSSNSGNHGTDAAAPPSVFATASTLIRAAAADPRAFVERIRDTLKSVLHVHGGRQLQIYLHASTRWTSGVWKGLAHGLGDLPFIVSLLLAPIGLVVGRRLELGLLLGLWITVVLGLTVLSGFGGPRLRAPIEPVLIVLSATVISGGYRRWRVVPMGIALGVSFLFAGLVAPQIPRSVAARGDYGVDWRLKTLPKRSPFLGEAGFNVLAMDGSLQLILRPRHADGGKTPVELWLNGEKSDAFTLDVGERRLSLEWPRTELVFVELVARDSQRGAPAKVFVVVPKR